MIAWTIYISFGGALAALLVRKSLSRWVALTTSIVGLGVAGAAFFCTDTASTPFATIVRLPWVPELKMEYHLAVDGVSLTLVLVTAITAVASILFSWQVDTRPNEFF